MPNIGPDIRYPAFGLDGYPTGQIYRKNSIWCIPSTHHSDHTEPANRGQRVGHMVQRSCSTPHSEPAKRGQPFYHAAQRPCSTYHTKWQLR
jgi:hypothetical protein